MCFSTTRRLINTLLEGVMTDPQPIDMTEIWKPVVGWVRSRDRLTAISDRMGRSYVRLQKGRILAEATGERGRKAVCLSLNSKHESWLVHRLVCIAFHGPAPTDRPAIRIQQGAEGRGLGAGSDQCIGGDLKAEAFQRGHALRARNQITPC